MLPTTLEIKHLRKNAGLTQKQLARAIGLSQSAVAKFENNAMDLNYQTVSKIVSYLTGLLSKEKACKEISTKKVIGLAPNDTVRLAVGIMKRQQISQLPVLEKNGVLGSLTEKGVLNLIDELGQKATYKKKLVKVMQGPFPLVNENSSISRARELLKNNQAVLTVSSNQITGIITATDLM